MSDTAHLYRVVQDERTGKLLSGVTVTLCNPGTQTAIPDKLYSDSTLYHQVPNPFTTPTGIIDVYLAAPRNVAVVTVYGASTTVADNIPVLPDASFLLATPVPVSVINGPGPNTVLMGIDAGAVQFVSLPDRYLTKQAAVVGWALSDAFTLVFAVRDAGGALVTADVVWPDGTPGTYTTVTVSPDFPGKVDAYSMTYDNPLSPIALTQDVVTRDATGSITSAPTLQAAMAAPAAPVTSHIDSPPYTFDITTSAGHLTIAWTGGLPTNTNGSPLNYTQAAYTGAGSTTPMSADAKMGSGSGTQAYEAPYGLIGDWYVYAWYADGNYILMGTSPVTVPDPRLSV